MLHEILWASHENRPTAFCSVDLRESSERVVEALDCFEVFGAPVARDQGPAQPEEPSPTNRASKRERTLQKMRTTAGCSSLNFEGDLNVLFKEYGVKPKLLSCLI